MIECAGWSNPCSKRAAYRVDIKSRPSDQSGLTYDFCVACYREIPRNLIAGRVRLR